MATSPKTPSPEEKETPRAKVGGTTARVETMRQEAFRLLKEGMSCPQIGDALGVSRERAWQPANEEMNAVRAETRQEGL